jgi:methionine biosynthesis protein MetW
MSAGAMRAGWSWIRNVAACVARGLSVIQGMPTPTSPYPDASFDYAILSQTLQTTKRPDLVMEHLLRIGRRAFQLSQLRALAGAPVAAGGRRMPVTRLLPVAWYETPNIHHLTIADFRDLWKNAGSRWRAHGS